MIFYFVSTHLKASSQTILLEVGYEPD